MVLTSIHRLQDKASTFKGPMDVVKTIIQKEGLLGAHVLRETMNLPLTPRFILSGLYVGMESTFWRFVPLLVPSVF